MLSPEGRCKTLDAAADGYVRAEAVGVMLLELRADSSSGAGSNGQVLAVLAGSAVNQDGRSSSLTAPNGPAQQEVLRAALAEARLGPDDVAALSTHGTGTPLGESCDTCCIAGAAHSGRAMQQHALLQLSCSQPCCCCCCCCCVRR